MQLNHDCIRSILLELESSLSYKETVSWKKNFNTLQIENEFDSFSSYKKYGRDAFFYSLDKLSEAGYINYNELRVGSFFIGMEFESITWNGHKFLDNIRDPKIWIKTKSIASKFESVAIDILSSTATKVLTNYIDKEIN